MVGKVPWATFIFILFILCLRPNFDMFYASKSKSIDMFRFVVQKQDFYLWTDQSLDLTLTLPHILLSDHIINKLSKIQQNSVVLLCAEFIGRCSKTENLVNFCTKNWILGKHSQWISKISWTVVFVYTLHFNSEP